MAVSSRFVFLCEQSNVIVLLSTPDYLSRSESNCSDEAHLACTFCPELENGY